MHLRGQKKLSNLKLKVDNANVHLQYEIKELKMQNQKLQTQLQVIRKQNQTIMGLIDQIAV